MLVLDRVSLWDYCEWLAAQSHQCAHFIPLGVLQDKRARRGVLAHDHACGWYPLPRWRHVLALRGQAPRSVAAQLEGTFLLSDMLEAAFQDALTLADVLEVVAHV